jgi:hypothetical protein
MFTQADVGAAVVGELVGGVAGDVLAVDDYLAFGIGIHAAQNVEHCGFAGAGCVELSYSGIPRDYALEILVSAVSSLRCDSAWHASVNANDNNSQYMLFCCVGGRLMTQQQQHRPAYQLN